MRPVLRDAQGLCGGALAVWRMPGVRGVGLKFPGGCHKSLPPRHTQLEESGKSDVLATAEVQAEASLTLGCIGIVRFEPQHPGGRVAVRRSIRSITAWTC